MKAKSAKPSSINEHRRCQRRTLNGQCRMPAVDPSGTLCLDHSRALDDHADHSAILTRFSRGFQTVEGINFALGDLYVLLAQGRISPRRAAVLTYMASLMLRTLPAMHKRMGKYSYRLIGATEIPPRESDEDDEDEEHQDELDHAAENIAAPENIDTHEEAMREAVIQEGSNQPEVMLKPIATVPPGQSPLPTTRVAFLDAVDQVIEQAHPKVNNRSNNEPDK